MGGATRCDRRRVRAYFLVKRTIARRITLTLFWFSYGQNAPIQPMLPKHAIVPMRLPDRSFWQPYFFLLERANYPPRLTGSAVRKKSLAEESSSARLANSVGCLLHQARDINAQFTTHGLFNRLERQCMILMACHSGNGQGAHHARTLYAQGEATARWRIIFI